MQALGFACRRLDNPVAGGPPLLLAERREAEAALTVLSYAHGDVVPGMDAQWSSGLSPWRLICRDGAWYGRDVADNKGQHSINLQALAAVLQARRGRLGCNLKLLFEMGEERSSPGLREACRRHAAELAADVFIASDGPRVSLGQATVYGGSRGSVVFSLRCAPRSGALHSGNWGGLMKNPAIRLSHAVSSMVGPSGRILVPGLLPPPMPHGVRQALAQLQVDSASLGRPIDAGWGDPGLSAAERLMGWNTLEVLALRSGDGVRPAAAIPPEAVAHCQLRHVVGTDVAELGNTLRRHLDAAGFSDVDVDVLRCSPATRLDPDSPWVGWVVAAARHAGLERMAIVPNLGGTVPNDAFADILGLPTLWLPHSYPGCRQHAADEHLPLSIAREALALMVSVWWQLGEPAAARLAHGATAQASPARRMQ